MTRRRERNIERRHFELTSKEGLAIRGVVDLPSDATMLVLMLHGFKGFRNWSFFPWLSETFSKQGLAVCRFDFSRCGITESSEVFDRLDLFEDDTYSCQIDDVESVVSHLRSEPASAGLPIALLGHSRGGGTALLSAKRVAAVAVATWATISHTDRWDAATQREWRASGKLLVENARTKQQMPVSTRILDDLEANRERLDIERAVRDLEIPLLVVHGKADETVPLAESRAVAAAGREVTLVEIDRASHTFGAIHPLITIPMHLSLAAHVSCSFLTTHSRRRSSLMSI